MERLITSIDIRMQQFTWLKVGDEACALRDTLRVVEVGEDL